jgi:hypothetical protein
MTLAEYSLLATTSLFVIVDPGAGQLSPLAMKLVTRLMGLLLAAVGMQFILNALEQILLFHR